MNGVSIHYADQRDVQSLRKELIAMAEKLDVIALDQAITRRAVQSICKHFRVSDAGLDGGDLAVAGLPSPQGPRALAVVALGAALAALVLAAIR